VTVTASFTTCDGEKVCRSVSSELSIDRRMGWIRYAPDAQRAPSSSKVDLLVW
jgi:hypothetical protein